MTKCLVFDIRGEWGHFRKIYTTSSPLSYSIPPRTALAGMLGALVGLDRKEYYNWMGKDKTYLALRIMSPIKKQRIGINLINTKTAKYFSQIRDRTQVKQELIKEPHYRIYFTHDDNDFYQQVKGYLEDGRSFYTLCMGLSEFIAQYQYVGEFQMTEIRGETAVEIHSVLPMVERCHITLGNADEDGAPREYFKETLPNDFEAEGERIVKEFITVLMERNGKPIICSPASYWQVGNGDNILFL